jgi:DNA-binding response OmpR family regulator
VRILLVAKDDSDAHSIRGVLAASTMPPFHVDHASNGWAAQSQAADGGYEALIVDDILSDTDGETLLGRLKAIGVSAPALVLTSSPDQEATGGGDDYLPKTEALHGRTLVRVIAAIVQRHQLAEELTAARAEAARATTLVRKVAHDLATPLGVVMGMSQVLLSEDNGLDADGREGLEDIAREALRACAILERLTDSEPQASPVSAAVTPRVPDVNRATPSGTGSKMVLIADDDPAMRRLLAATLDSDQFSVLQAADGEEAWRLIREHHPAVAILDWQMPIYNGLELTAVIKGDPLVRDMTVIMLTGRSGEADRQAGARAQADVYLIKPFAPQELLAAVEHALGIAH